MQGFVEVAGGATEVGGLATATCSSLVALLFVSAPAFACHWVVSDRVQVRVVEPA